MTLQAHKVSSLTRLSCKIMADKAKRHDRDSGGSNCDSSEDSRNNDQKQARKKTKKYKTRYSKEWEKTYPFLKVFLRLFPKRSTSSTAVVTIQISRVCKEA